MHSLQGARAHLDTCDVLLVGDGSLAEGTARALLLRGVGQISSILLQTGGFDLATQRRWRSFLERHAPGAVVRNLPRGLETLVESRVIPQGIDLVVDATDDGWLHAWIRRACERSGVPRVECGAPERLGVGSEANLQLPGAGVSQAVTADERRGAVEERSQAAADAAVDLLLRRSGTPGFNRALPRARGTTA